MDSAAALDITEFDLFRLAYRRWFGQQPEPEALERIFADYMLRGTVPFWLRRLCIDLEERRAGGDLPPDTLDAQRYRDRPAPPRRRALALATLAAIWAILFAGLLNLEPDPAAVGDATCGSGSAVATAWVTLLAAESVRQRCHDATSLPPASQVAPM